MAKEQNPLSLSHPTDTEFVQGLGMIVAAEAADEVMCLLMELITNDGIPASCSS